MTFLLDENLPYQLGDALSISWVHATRVGDQATDTQLWESARKENWIIITKDTDFFDRLMQFGPPPKVIWVRLGNMRKQELISHLAEKWPHIRERIALHDMVQIHPRQLESLDF